MHTHTYHVMITSHATILHTVLAHTLPSHICTYIHAYASISFSFFLSSCSCAMAMAMTSSLFASSSAFHDSSSLLREEPTCLFNFHNHNNTTRRKCHKAQSPRQHRQSANRNLLPVCALRGIPNTIPAFPNDPFLSRLAEMVSPSSSSSSSFPDNPNSEGLPLLDLVSGPSKLMAAPGQVKKSNSLLGSC